ncbi:hypothetical protein GRI38_12170 [Altererythrobacter aurantiacus]|uniref:Uncharacterized protein n=1 Tax=Parapontixanthobacter aurantiacus TaxID=1463599 RepID=A0A844ZE38_9SPHN|nr:hypothetical protein [Parapontixanthobacter aurantiacus]MXO86781.1 hypothetical protein [Parapontixanthobacter aurantiacus]
MAHLALRLDPTSPSALRVLGQVSATDGNEEKARQLILAGNSLNRRDRQSTLWLIDDSVQSGDIDRGMSYFDQLLRTLGDDRGSVIALLTELLSDPRAIAPMERILRRRPNWSEQFWLFVPGNAQALENAATLRVRLDKSMTPEDKKSDSALIASLADAGYYAAGFRVARAVHPELNEVGINNPEFSSSADVAPYNWQATGSNAFAVNISERTDTLEISSSPGSSGDIIRQLVRLNPGTYRPVIMLSGDYQDQSLPELTLSLQCAGSDERQNARLNLPRQRSEERQTLTASANCERYWLTLSTGYSMSAYDISIDRIDLVR